MASPETGDDPALSAGAWPEAARRWLVIGASVLIPITLGALATVALYATRTPAPPPAPVTTAAPAASDTEISQGQVLIVQPATTNQVKLPLGEELEIVLQTGPGQTVVSETPDILSPVASNPPCYDVTICGVPGTGMWTFDPLHAGVGYLKISFGRHCSPTTGDCDGIHIVLLKPFAVYSRPQAQ